MKLEFIGGSRDGGTIDVPAKMIPTSPLFDGPVYLQPVPPMIQITEEVYHNSPPLTYKPPFCEVYSQTEPGKLLFIGWRE